MGSASGATTASALGMASSAAALSATGLSAAASRRASGVGALASAMADAASGGGAPLPPFSDGGSGAIGTGLCLAPEHAIPTSSTAQDTRTTGEQDFAFTFPPSWIVRQQ